MKARIWESTVQVARTVFISSAVVSSAVGLSGCSALFSGSEENVPTSAVNLTGSEDSTWLADGLIAIARPIPALATGLALKLDGSTPGLPAPIELNSTTMLGFMPLPPTQAAAWLSIDTARQTISLMTGDAVIKSGSGEGLANLKPGTYRIAHKQEQPLWHAPASYFEARGLPTPAEGDRARYRRGALGDLALFIDQDTPIHSGPIWSSEIGGVKLDEELITPLFKQLEVGARIEVK